MCNLLTRAFEFGIDEIIVFFEVNCRATCFSKSLEIVDGFIGMRQRVSGAHLVQLLNTRPEVQRLEADIRKIELVKTTV